MVKLNLYEWKENRKLKNLMTILLRRQKTSCLFVNVLKSTLVNFKLRWPVEKNNAGT